MCSRIPVRTPITSTVRSKSQKIGRHFQHADGTPFFWLGDTWWMGLCKRLSWPDGFQTLTADRVQKGFTIVQIVAGLYPDMEPFDARGANEAGFPWEPDFSRINPAYFDMADVRIQHLADQGLAACVVGFWGYFIPRMGMAKVKQHWRYLIARWGAYPVVWCLAGEGTMPYYLSKTKEQDAETQKHGLTELARYVRATDPRHHPITIHPSKSSRLCVDDPAVLDFDMLQTGHNDRQSVPNTIETVNHSLAATPKMPVLIGEVCYEGIAEASRQEVQRFMFWSSSSGWNGRTHLRSQRHLAGEYAAATLRTFAAWPFLGRPRVGYRRATSRLGTARIGQRSAHSLFLVETGTPARSHRTPLEHNRLLATLRRPNPRRSRHCLFSVRFQASHL